VAALISRATGVEPYFVGKPNSLMMRSALNEIGAHSETAAMVGDRMDTDVVSGLEAGMHTVLVLTGSTQLAEAERFPYRPVADRRLDRRPRRRARMSDAAPVVVADDAPHTRYTAEVGGRAAGSPPTSCAREPSRSSTRRSTPPSGAGASAGASCAAPWTTRAPGPGGPAVLPLRPRVRAGHEEYADLVPAAERGRFGL
jgi:hypothetical protein